MSQPMRKFEKKYVIDECLSFREVFRNESLILCFIISTDNLTIM
jgi:hypothetical protein